jgi:uncharacterized protein involved in exopolysaccharide biosynthesis
MEVFSAMDRQGTMFDYVLVFLRRKRAIILFVFFFAIGALLYSLFATKIYRAECRILPSSSGAGSGNAALSSAFSQLAAFGGVSLGGASATKGELMIGIMQSYTIIDKIIDRFDLMEVYGKDSRIEMREYVATNAFQAKEDSKSGIVTVFVLDKDPNRAARMANAFVDELKILLQSLAIDEAAQRRMFFEEQLFQARTAMDTAESELQKYQEKSGIVAVEPQVSAMLTSIAALRTQIAAKEVEISSMKTYARSGNPDLKRAESELVALRSELFKIEQNQAHESSDSNSLASLREAPQLGLEYQRRLRDVQYATVIYDIMLKQFEAAKIDESRETMVVQVLDPAIPPDKKFEPKRLRIVIFAVFMGLCLGILWALTAEYIAMLKKDPDQNKVLNDIGAMLSLRKR